MGGLIANAGAQEGGVVGLGARRGGAPVPQRDVQCGKEVETLGARAAQALCNRIATQRNRLDGHAKMLVSLSYQSVLQRGFAVVRDAQGRTVREAAHLHAGDALEVEFRDGRADVETRSVRVNGEPRGQQPSASAPANPSLRRTRRSGGSGQGSLF